jgi:hypothetical protein
MASGQRSVARVKAKTRPRTHWNVLITQVERIVGSRHAVAIFLNHLQKCNCQSAWYAMRPRWKLPAKRFELRLPEILPQGGE